ncbi:DUF397 domain-containing protein [Gandjariella thermophila]|nr:DUF397 domain-containing protein [Gandjariella thermophila]
MAETSATRWRKSSRSSSGGNCVELALLPGGRMAVRDSKCPQAGTLVFPSTTLTALLTSARNGQLDL